MVNLNAVHLANEKLVQSQPLVAVFVAATGGIGEYAVRALARAHSTKGKGLRVYIIARRQDAAEKVIDECRHDCPDGQFRFVKAEDLSLLKDVDRVCDEIIRLEQEDPFAGGNPRVDIMIMSQGILAWGDRRDTKEGLELNMSLTYYSRMRCIVRLLPLLLASPLPAHVVTVHTAGMEAKFFPDDLSLRNPENYRFANRRSHHTHMTTLFLEELAKKHAGKLSLSHEYPYLVITGGFDNPYLPTWFRKLFKWLVPVLSLLALTPEESGDRTIYMATPRFPARGQEVNDDEVKVATGTDDVLGGGAYSVNWNGEVINVEEAYKKFNKEDIAGRVWEHTMKAFDEIEAGRVFTG